MKKFLDKGNVIAIVYDKMIIGMANLYCNNYDTKEAYLNNVELLKEYRGIGLSKLIVEKAICVAKDNNFLSIKLNVEESNLIAVNLYKKYGFIFTNNYKEIDGVITKEMVLEIGD